ncbi:hypothetical protein MMC16_005993 [Acarospora aff. strigata]|nr:hypothetical protein [Acarospora aff. strigata]
MGDFFLADHGPFSQVARFDPHHGCRKISQDIDRYSNLVPITQCIDYALGILRTTQRGHRNYVIFPRDVPRQTDGSLDLIQWQTRPSKVQLNGIRYAIEQLVSVSGADLLKYAVETAEEQDFESRTMKQIAPGINRYCPGLSEALLVGHALAALIPWGLRPVLPPHFVNAFLLVLRSFVGTRIESVGCLQGRLLSKPGCRPTAGWTDIHEQAMGLGQVGDIKTQSFCQAGTPCWQYFQAMNVVFDRCRARIADVRIELAAQAAYDVLQGQLAGNAMNFIVDEDIFVERMASHLHGERRYLKAPSWAVTIYATFLWGWLNDFIATDDDFNAKFRRRVFLS